MNIFKYSLEFVDEQSVHLPKGSSIIFSQVEDRLHLYAMVSEVSDQMDMETHRITIKGPRKRLTKPSQIRIRRKE